MAGPSKRTRHAYDVDGSEDDIEVESASSGFRQNVNKRTKVALAQEARASGDLVSDTEDENDGQRHFDDLLQDDQDSEMDADVEYSLRQYSDNEDEEEEVDELKATQIVRKQMSRYKDNIPMDEGIIEEVFCRNFMCHSKLRITLGPLINFIVGHNGSGKSAVLTALQICLGGKATTTNRAANLKSFIKTGQDSATLSVKIKNQGENAYKPDQFGKSIIVERHFSRAGTSGFRIKNEHGREISKRKAELDDILDYFALQLDNPINVLTQDRAREFLSNSSPAEKYKFFIKGTNLQTLDSDYQLFEEQLDGINETLRIREGDIERLREARDQAEQRKKRGERTAQMHQKIRALQRQLAWAQVEDQEATLKSYSQDVRNQEEEVSKLEEEAEAVDARFEAADMANEAAKRTVEEYREQLQPVITTHASEKEIFSDHTDVLIKARTEQRQIRDAVKTHKNTAKRLADEIKLEQQCLSDAGGAEHARRIEEFAQLREQIEEARRKEAEHAESLPDLEMASKEAEGRVTEGNAEKDQASKHALTAQATLRSHDQQQGGKFDPYIANMARLCQAINQETRWRSKPIGPLGLHVQLLKPKWSSILEKTLGTNLEAFVVSCKDDQAIFSQIAKRVNCHASVFIGSSASMDTTQNEPEDNVDTMLSVLRFDEPAVRNILIMMIKAEQIVLIEDSKQASEYMMKRPKNVSATLALGTQRGFGIRYDLSRSGEFRSGPIHPWNGHARMKTDRAEQRQMLLQRVHEAQKEADNAIQHHRTLTRQLEEAKQAVVRHKRDLVNLRTTRQRAEDDAQEKQEEIDRHQPKDGRLQELQRQHDEAKDEQRSSEASLQDSYDNTTKLNETAKELKEKLDAVQADLDIANQRVHQAEERIRATEAQRQAVLLEKNEAHDNVTTAKDHVSRLQERVNGQQDTLDNFISEASKVSERVVVEPGMSWKAMDDRLTQLSEQYHREQRRAGGAQEDLIREFKEAEKAYLEAQMSVNEMVDIEKRLKETLKERRRRWKLFRKYISSRAKINFSYLLSERQFRGRVRLNHDTQELDIKVEPDMARESDSGRQAKTLSGGEKSFSTICLLLSIWEAMGSPIRCLDEFDVFMDSVNRKQSMDLMIQTARRSVGRQFILITPQSMQNVDMADDVRVHKMSDPERGQQTLAFHGQEA